MQPILQVTDIFGDLPALETARLLLRRLTADDAAEVFAYASHPEVARYTTWEHHQSLQDSLAFLEAAIKHYERGEVGPWGVILKAPGRLIGTCGFAWWMPLHARAEIGYAIGRDYWNQGLTTEAVREVVRFGFDRMRLNRIEARCELENVASERVMQKTGMRFEGVLREQMFSKGRFVDLKLYAILRRDYGAGQRDGEIARTAGR